MNATTRPSRKLLRKARSPSSASAAEGLEPRSYLSGVAFSAPINSNATSFANVSPVYVDLDHIFGLGYADLVTANSNNGNYSVSIFQGNGNGTFAAPTTIPLDFPPLTLRAGVLSGGAGLTDIVVGSPSSSDFGVITQTSGGHFSEQDYATSLANTRSVAIGDFNGDGKLDVAVASDDGGTSSNIEVFLNNGSGGFAPTPTNPVLSVAHANIASITAFTAGGTTDLAIADSTDNDVTTLTNNGSGTFTVGQDYPLGQNGTDPVTIVDGQFDTVANSNDDLVTANATGGSVSLLVGNGDGTFQTTAKTTSITGAAPGGGPLKVRVARLSSDGNLDLVSLLSSGSAGDAEVLLGNGDGTFRVGNIISLGDGAQTGIAAGDLNDDMLTDMVLSNESAVTSLINITNQDTTAPTAALSVNQPSVSAGAATIDFTVTYTDAEQVDTSTLSSNNLTVTTPSGATDTATLVSTNLAPAASVTVTYSIPAQSNSASPADDGTYVVTTTSDTTAAVKNANGVPVAGASIGQFVVTVTTVASNGPDLVAGAVTVRNPANAVAGTRFAGATSVTVLNSGNQLAKGKIVINLYASPDQTIRGGSPVLVSVTRNVNLKPAHKVVFGLPGFKWPTTTTNPSTFFIVANVNATQSLAETNYSDNVGISAKATVVTLPFVNIDNLWNGKLPATLKVGKRASLAVALENIGNVAARATAAFTIQAVDASNNLTTVGTGTVRVAAAATKGRQTIALPVTLPSTLASGTYHLLVTVSYPGDTDALNDSATSATTFTV